MQRLIPRSLLALVLLAALLVPAVAAPPAAARPTEFLRLAGADRYETAVAVSQALLPNGGPVDYVLVATGENWPDGILGGLAASQLRTSVLLVRTHSVPASTAAELARLDPLHIVVLGGPAAVSPGVVDALAPYADEVNRIGGIDRYETAAQLMWAYVPAGPTEAFIASGTDFRTALLAAAEGAFYGNGPAFLVPPDGPLPAPVAGVLDAIGPLRALWITGGTDLVSDAMADQLAPYAGVVVRDTGADVYEISVNAWEPVIQGAGSPAVILATSAAFPDGLVGAAVAGAARWPLFLSEPDCIPGVVLDAMDRLGADGMVLLGGTAALGPPIEALARCGAGAPPVGECPLATTSEVEAAVGRNLDFELSTGWQPVGAPGWPPHESLECGWIPGGSPTSPGPQLAALRFDTIAGSQEAFMMYRTGEGAWEVVVPVAGLGDEAFAGLVFGESLFVVRAGRIIILLYDPGPHANVNAVVQAQRALMAAVLARV